MDFESTPASLSHLSEQSLGMNGGDDGRKMLSVSTLLYFVY